MSPRPKLCPAMSLIVYGVNSSNWQSNQSASGGVTVPHHRGLRPMMPSLAAPTEMMFFAFAGDVTKEWGS